MVPSGVVIAFARNQRIARVADESDGAELHAIQVERPVVAGEIFSIPASLRSHYGKLAHDRIARELRLAQQPPPPEPTKAVVSGRRLLVTVGPDDDGLTFIRFAKRLMPSVPAGMWHKLLRKKEIWLLERGSAVVEEELGDDQGGAPAAEDIEVHSRIEPSHRVTTNEVYRFPPTLLREAAMEKDVVGLATPSAQVLGLVPVWADEHYMCFNKPPGMCVQGGTAQDSSNVLAALPGFHSVHRLDKLTSGLLIGARSREAAHQLMEVWPTAVKTYFAICSGGPFEYRSDDIRESILSVDGRVTQSMDPKAMSAHTSYRVEREGPDGLSLVRLQPHTGRKHQLRVHMSALGHPVYGDAAYGGIHADRLYLHAYSITVEHPMFPGTVIMVEAPLPLEFERAMGVDRYA